MQDTVIIMRHKTVIALSQTLCALGKSQALGRCWLPFGNQSNAKCAVLIDAGVICFLRAKSQSIEHLAQLSEPQISLQIKHHHCLQLTHEVYHSLSIAGHQRRGLQLAPYLLLDLRYAILRPKSNPHNDRPQMFFALQSILKSGHFLPDTLILPGDFLQPCMAALKIQIYLSQQAFIIKRNCLSQCIFFGIDCCPQLGMQQVTGVELICDLCICIIQSSQLLSYSSMDCMRLIVDGEQIYLAGFRSMFLAMNGKTVPAKREEALAGSAEMADEVVFVECAGSRWAFVNEAFHANNIAYKSSKSSFFPCIPSCAPSICFFFACLAATLIRFLFLNTAMLLDKPFPDMRKSKIHWSKRTLSEQMHTLFGWQGSASCSSKYSISFLSDLYAAQCKSVSPIYLGRCLLDQSADGLLFSPPRCGQSHPVPISA